MRGEDHGLLQRRWRWVACAALSGLAVQVFLLAVGDGPLRRLACWGDGLGPAACCAAGCPSRRLAQDLNATDLNASALDASDPNATDLNSTGLNSTSLNSTSLSSTGYLEGEEIIQVWSSTYILWSLAIAMFGAYVAFTTTMYMKQAMAMRSYWVMLVQAGLALGVNTIWCMHFVGMQALTLQGGTVSKSTAKVSITFEPIFTLVSAVAAWAIATLALHIALGSGSRTESDTLITQRVTAVSAVQSVRSVRDAGKSLRRVIVTVKEETPIRRISLAAVLVMVGVVIMHYMGMLSQSGNFTMAYNPYIIAASGVVAAVASWAGLVIFFIIFDSLLYRTMSAIIVALAVNGMHYTGMQAARYYASPFHGIWGSSTVSWDMPAMQVLIGVILADFFLMAATGYYVEILETVRKREGEAYEKELRYKAYIRESRSLILRSRIMRFPMCLVRYDTFVRNGKLVSHEVLRRTHGLVYIDTTAAATKLREKRFIVFFSHQWLSTNAPDPSRRQFREMLTALAALSKVYRLKPENVFVWIDYCSIPQAGTGARQLAIDSLTSYAAAASAFVIVAPSAVHAETLTPCNFSTYSKTFWCRLEVFCSLLSTLRHKAADASARSIPEEDEEAVAEPAVMQPQSMDAPDIYVTTCNRISTTGSPHVQHSPDAKDGQLDAPAKPEPEGGGVSGADTASNEVSAVRSSPASRMTAWPLSPTSSSAAPPRATVATARTLVHAEDPLRPGLEHHRIFRIVDEQLRRLSFFTADGTIRKDYEELLFVFEGELECCRRGHTGPDGGEIVCEKLLLVPSLCGCFGAMLEDLRKSRKRESSTGRSDGQRRVLAERIFARRHDIFPGEYFDTRIDAMQAAVEGVRATETTEEEEGKGEVQVDQMSSDESDVCAVESTKTSDGDRRPLGPPDPPRVDLEAEILSF